MPSVSVIIPVFNTEKYLAACIESLRRQSFKDFEVLLVDDGSTDGSGRICDEYSKTDDRIVAVHKENGGVCSARNAGLDAARGEFVVFVDADDCLNESHLEHLMDSDADLVLTGIQKFGSSSDSCAPVKKDSFEIKDLPRHWNTPPVMNYLYCYPVAKRFRTSIIQDNNIRFYEPLFFSEDMCFNMRYMSFAKSFTELPYADYMYRRDEDMDRNEKYKMSAEQLSCHYEYLDACFDQLYKQIEPDSLSFVRDNTVLRLMRKFVSYLLQDGMTPRAFVRNVKEFRKKEWSDYMLGLLNRKTEKRVMREAVRFPFLTYWLEVRAVGAIRRRSRHSN